MHVSSPWRYAVQCDSFTLPRGCNLQLAPHSLALCTFTLQDDGKPRRGVNNNGQDDSKEPKHDTSKADGTHATTIVLTFVVCALVAVVALA